MKTIPNKRLRQQGIVLWILILIVVMFILIIGGIFYTVVKNLYKLVPPPPPDDNGVVNYPLPGTHYGGGVVVGPQPHLDLYVPITNGPVAMCYIMADDLPNPTVWTNCIWYGAFDDLTNQMGTNGLPLEKWPEGQMPPHRFYNIFYAPAQP
jgi:hypothetical protein